MKRLALFFALLASLSLLAGCKKADPAPVTGTLTVTVTVPFYYTIKSYALYTEGSYNTTAYVNPLRQGTVVLGALTSGSQQVTTTLTDLNTGNYVFLFGNVPLSVQVSAGQTNTFVHVIQ